jgi:PAS domain S-box-containing protein
LQGRPEAREFRAWHRDGSLLWLRGSSLAEIEDGVPVGIIGIISDLTGHHRTELALRDSEDRYRDLVENSQDLLCTHDLQGRLLSINPAPARLLGYSIDELLKIPMRDLVTPAFRTEFDNYLARIAKHGSDNGYLAVMTKAVRNESGSTATLSAPREFASLSCAEWPTTSPNAGWQKKPCAPVKNAFASR